MHQFTIDALTPDDWPAVREIYLQGLATGLASFETTAPAWNDWDRSHLAFARLAAREGSALLGWAALSPVSSRAVYQGVAEVSVYIRESVRGQGIGSALLTVLVRESEAHGIWTLQSSIFPENQASVAVHLGCGFRVVGRRERIARREGVWRDTLLLERRSSVGGVGSGK